MWRQAKRGGCSIKLDVQGCCLNLKKWMKKRAESVNSTTKSYTHTRTTASTMVNNLIKHGVRVF